MTERLSVEQLVRETRVALEVAKNRHHLFKGWQALHETDQNGQTRGPLPYTEEAITEFTQGLAHDPDNPDILHHLAICTHAKAWDMELANNPAAGAEWEKALGYWRSVISSPVFWQKLKEKLANCNPDEDPGFIKELRNNLYEHLLDIHVDFIRSYFEKNTPERVGVHVALIGRARIPPAVRTRMISRLFDAMTVMVPQYRANREFKAALKLVEQFLKLYPIYLPALQLCMELCKEIMASLSYVDDWDTLTEVRDTTQHVALRLIEHKGLQDAPLARTALEELAIECMSKGRNRGSHHEARLKARSFSQEEYDKAEKAITQARDWGRMVLPLCPASSLVRPVLAGVLNSMALLISNHEFVYISESDLDMKTKLDTQIFLLKKCVNILEEAVGLDAEDAILKGNLDLFKEQLESLEQVAAIPGFGSL